MKTIRVGLVGSQFVSSIHAEALRSVPYTEIVAVASATESHARAFAERHGIQRWFTDFRKMCEMPEIDLVVLGLPNDCTARRRWRRPRRASTSSAKSRSVSILPKRTG